MRSWCCATRHAVRSVQWIYEPLRSMTIFPRCSIAGAIVIAATSSEDKAERLRALGADHIINYAEQDFVQEIYRLYGKPARRGKGSNQGVDVVVNYTGGDTWTRSLRVLRVGGRMLTCGATAGYDRRKTSALSGPSS